GGTAASGDAVRLSGYVANPQVSRANNRLQYLLLNGRPIRDRSLQHALGEAYRGLLLSGRQPICFLRLDMPPSLVDVNVHPTKLEVRFAEAGRLYSQLLATIRTKFLTSDLQAVTPSVPRAVDRADDEVADATQGEGEIVAWAKRELDQRRLDLSHETPAPPFRHFPSSGGSQPLTLRSFTPAAETAARARDADGGNVAANRDIAGEAAARAGSSSTPAAEGAKLAGVEDDPARGGRASTPRTSARSESGAIQLHNRYLIIENEAGLEVIDQHALHERILYEQVRERVLAGDLETQQLLVPEPVDLTAAEAAAAMEHRGLLARLGVDVQPFGGETVLVASYPAMLANLPPAEVLRDLVDRLLSGGKAPDARDLLDELLHSVSCKAAVKYGDRLSPEEIDALLAARPLTQNHHHCPHGRPTALVFTCEELDRRFQRT
ncbi:MAG: DNA mismatch repair endonuclease MutL, partial [Planctomycetota bacterium]